MGRACYKLTEFDNSKGSCYARWRDVSGERFYVCFSYGDWWPLYMFSEATKTWYGNSTRYTRPTTNRHATLACPRDVEITWLPVDDMIDLSTHGLVGYIQQKFKQAA
jgi:hypothetical protein